MVRCEVRDVKTREVIQHDYAKAFPLKKHFGRLLSEVAKFNSNSCISNNAYVLQKANMLRHLRANWKEAELVELIIHGMKLEKILSSVTQCQS